MNLAETWRQLKEKYGGYEAVVEKFKKIRHIYFNKETGKILYLGHDEVDDLANEYEHIVCEYDEVKHVDEEGISQYLIIPDLKEPEKYNIEKKTPVVTHVKSDEHFLYHVPVDKAAAENEEYDIRCEITQTDFIVTIHSYITERYATYDADQVTFKGSNIFKFYLTEPDDPHFMYRGIVVPVSDLLEDKQVAKPLDADLRHCSIYTVKLLDKYVRT